MSGKEKCAKFSRKNIYFQSTVCVEDHRNLTKVKEETGLDEPTCTCWCACKCLKELGNVEELSWNALEERLEDFIANPSTTLRGASYISLPALEKDQAIRWMERENVCVAEGLTFIAAFHTENENLLKHVNIERLCSKCLLSFHKLSKELKRRRTGVIPFQKSKKNIMILKTNDVKTEILCLNHLILLHLLDRFSPHVLLVGSAGTGKSLMSAALRPIAKRVCCDSAGVGILDPQIEVHGKIVQAPFLMDEVDIIS